jgi:uncharacterized protein YecE (DUF72 family)
VAALHVKPDLPLPPAVGGAQPIVRFIAHPQPEVDEPWLQRWARTLDEWLVAGRTPFLMMHCPNNAHSPALARRAHELLRSQSDVGSMPGWPGEGGLLPDRQLSLFAAL